MRSNQNLASKNAGPAFVAIGTVFMVTINVALGASFLAIGAALIVKAKNDESAGQTCWEDAK